MIIYFGEMRAQTIFLLALGVAIAAADRKPYGIQLPAFGSQAVKPQKYHIRPTPTGSDYFIFGSPLGSGHVLEEGAKEAGSPAEEGGAFTRGEVSDIEAFSATFSRGFADLPEYETFATVPRVSYRKIFDDSLSVEDDDDDDK
ncbi:uncharacterized protein [Macrobrachium rosenbergii]|uniref:uncharacterized protein n=1 Tax=Macrobrachium rosenbergii TaxID=79674 RepID=UPI0034D50B7E